MTFELVLTYVDIVIFLIRRGAVKSSKQTACAERSAKNIRLVIFGQGSVVIVPWVTVLDASISGLLE
jgi:hypothetical protein